MNNTHGYDLSQMINGFKITQMIYVAAKLSIADLLQSGSRSSEELADATKVDSHSLHRVMRALASLGVFHENADGTYELTPLSELLRNDVPGSQRGAAIMWGEDWSWRPWGQLLQSVSTGEPSFDLTFGTGIFDYFTEHGDAGEIFHAAMTSLISLDSEAIIDAYDFSGISDLVDVGGGEGVLLTTLLKSYHELTGTIFDVPSVVQSAEEAIRNAGVSDRCNVVGGDFFESVPSGADAYVLKFIIHDWDDDRALSILRVCRRSMNDSAKILIVDRVIPGPNKGPALKVGDITMMVLTGGLERTESEFRDLLQSAGFRLNRIIPTKTQFSILEAMPS